MAVPTNINQNSVQTLPDEIQKLLNNAVMGAIYVNFSSCSVPKEALDVLLASFSELKQIVIWEQNDLPDNLPSNILRPTEWSPNSILSHKNIRLIVTSGETSVLKLALFYGVPMLIIPFGNTQLHSAINSSDLENVSLLRLNDLSETTFSCTLNTMLSDKKFENRAKEISKLLQQKMSRDCSKWEESIARQKELSNTSAVPLHLDALGGLFFVIFVVVKVSLKFCQFYNSCGSIWRSNVATKKTK